MKNKLIPFTILFLLFFARLTPHPANFSPMAAMAIFGSYYFPKKWAIVLPVMALFISDIFLGFYGAEMFFVYGSFILIALISKGWLKKIHPVRIVSVAFTGSVLFFVITNFGVWLTTNLYPMNFSGLLLCYQAAIPFFRNTLLGDQVYVLTFFGIYSLAGYFERNLSFVKS